MAGKRHFFDLIALAALSGALSSHAAHAYPFYVDAQAGTAMFLNTGGPPFNSGSSSASNLGIGASLGLFYSPMESANGIDFQLGVNTILSSVTQGTSSNFMTLAPYGVARLQIWWFYFGAGISPFVMTRSENSQGFDNLGQSSGTLAYLGEVGFLYPATPEFSMGGGVTGQWFSTSGTTSTSPNLAFNFVMRFYFSLFGIGHDGPGPQSSLEFRGWRYIGK